MNPNKTFPLLVWISTLLIAPMLIVVANYLSPHPDFEFGDIQIFLMYVLIGLIFSAPVFGLSYILYLYLINKGFSKFKIKAMYSSFSITGCIVTFLILAGIDDFIHQNLILIGCYSASIIISIFLFRVYKIEKAANPN
jgi:hypothetical protein